ncbi:unnamed protein product [Schistosoma curassoni]|uniref:Uncharacterized protein n=1 Tax=Schistosoma curassoni TaxID=6186 RepID=A0A183KJF5_9TREM|nr:unnamed protein product [Schistosoma curassoni]
MIYIIFLIPLIDYYHQLHLNQIFVDQFGDLILLHFQHVLYVHVIDQLVLHHAF